MAVNEEKNIIPPLFHTRLSPPHEALGWSLRKVLIIYDVTVIL
jgi:hypothetical protein